MPPELAMAAAETVPAIVQAPVERMVRGMLELPLPLTVAPSETFTELYALRRGRRYMWSTYTRLRRQSPDSVAKRAY
jgi:hypothetical protein